MAGSGIVLSVALWYNRIFVLRSSLDAEGLPIAPDPSLIFTRTQAWSNALVPSQVLLGLVVCD